MLYGIALITVKPFHNLLLFSFFFKAGVIIVVQRIRCCSSRLFTLIILLASVISHFLGHLTIDITHQPFFLPAHHVPKRFTRQKCLFTWLVMQRAVRLLLIAMSLYGQITHTLGQITFSNLWRMQKSTCLLIRLEWWIANAASLPYFLKDLLFEYSEVCHLLQLKQFRCTGFLQLGLLLFDQALLVFVEVGCCRLRILAATLAFIVVVVGLRWAEVLTRLFGIELGRYSPIPMVVSSRLLV